MDKTMILQALEKMVLLEIEKQKKAIETTRQAVFDAPGRMESRYDTTKTEMGWLADGLNKRLAEMQNLLQTVRALNSDRCYKAGEGALVTCQRACQKYIYFIVEGGAGRKVVTTEGPVTCVSPAAPICQQIMGLAAGATAKFGKEDVTILEVL